MPKLFYPPEFFKFRKSSGLSVGWQLNWHEQGDAEVIRGIREILIGSPRYCLLLSLFFFVFVNTLFAQQLAFPGAEGFGAYATGGRGGTVVHVTNLNATGPGSLMDACSKPNRIVVFDVGGVIKLSPSDIIMVASNITIAGQTAPGDGITIYGNRFVSRDSNNIIRYLRIRGSINMANDKCALTLDGGRDIIYDHCSISWGRWDNMHTKEAKNITMQYCIVGEGIDPQRFGAITDGASNWTVHHCLWIDNKSRNPKMKCSIQYVNNVVYNYGCCGIVGGHSSADNYQDVINNYFIAGPNSGDGSGYFSDWTSTDHLYRSGNYKDLDLDGTLNGSLDTSYHGATAQAVPSFKPTVPVIAESAADAYNSVLSSAGASIIRDSTDVRLINQLDSKGTLGRIIDSEADVHGTGLVFGAPAPIDTDHDGMPDYWETQNGLNPNDSTDAREYSKNGDGYTNIEEYINSINFVAPFLKGPVNVTATTYSENQINLKWSDYSTTEAGFILERSTDKTNYTVVDTVKANITSFSDVNLTKNVVYSYRIRAYNAILTSVYSSVVSARTSADLASAPSPSNGATYVNAKNLKLSWTQNPDITSCQVYLGTDSLALVHQADVTTNSYIPSVVKAGTQYYWRVDVVNASGVNTGDLWSFKTKQLFPMGLVAYWKMDSTLDGSTVTDSSSYKNEGDMNDMDNVLWPAGVFGKCIDFKNSTGPSNILVQHIDPLYFDNNPFSISLWMKAPSTQGECYLIHKGDFGDAILKITGKWFGLQLKSPNITFAIDDNVTKTSLDIANTPFLTNEWIHVVAVRDTLAKVIKLYRNGVLAGKKTDATKTSIGQTEPLYLGNSSDLNVPYLGKLDDVRIYNYALSDAEINKLYTEPLPAVPQIVSPVNLSQRQDTVKLALNWQGGRNTLWYNLYFGTDSTNLTLKVLNTVDNSCTLTGLSPNTTYYWRVDAGNDNFISSGTRASFTTSSTPKTGVSSQDVAEFSLYPNPFNKTVTIQFGLLCQQKVVLQIYDISGKLVKSLINANLSDGNHTVYWDGTDSFNHRVQEGIYFCKLQTLVGFLSKKVVFIKN